jgi:hypothetical protein
LANALSYVWNYSGTGATINGTGNSVTIDFSTIATPGNLSVYGVFACGNGAASPALPVTITAATNPTSGGTIGNAQSDCAAFDPDPITCLTLPSGYLCGVPEYKWQSSAGGSPFTDIANSNTASFDPPLITQTTLYKRNARIEGMPDWTGAAESNIIEMTIDSTAALPPPWLECLVGNSYGSAGYSLCNGVEMFELHSQGTSSANADVQEFVYQNLTGNGSIIARAISLTGAGWAGIQIRESCSPGSKKVLLKTQFQPLIRSEVRNVTNGAHLTNQFLRQGIKWLKMIRNGNRFDAYSSSDGLNWRLAFSSTVAMTGNVQVGLFSEGISATGSVSAKFDNVSVATGAKSTDEDVQETIAETQVEIYPNPAEDYVNIRISNFTPAVALRILSAEGKQMKLVSIENPTTRIELNDLPSGVYLLQFNMNGVMMTKRLVVF